MISSSQLTSKPKLSEENPTYPPTVDEFMEAQWMVKLGVPAAVTSNVDEHVPVFASNIIGPVKRVSNYSQLSVLAMTKMAYDWNGSLRFAIFSDTER
jgi:hypothetical protein